MPALTHADSDDQDKRKWLEDYFTSYLQRDLLDLGRLAGVTSPTARKFMRYLEMSYQVLQLPAFYRNPEKRLAKQPKVVFVDPGVRRGILRKSGALDGFEWESAVIAEICKQVQAADLPIGFFHLRTLDGRQVDLLLEFENGFVAVECKMTAEI